MVYKFIQDGQDALHERETETRQWKIFQKTSFLSKENYWVDLSTRLISISFNAYEASNSDNNLIHLIEIIEFVHFLKIKIII